MTLYTHLTELIINTTLFNYVIKALFPPTSIQGIHGPNAYTNVCGLHAMSVLHDRNDRITNPLVLICTGGEI